MRRQTSSFQFLCIFILIGFGGGFSLFTSRIRNFADSESVSSPTETETKQSIQIEAIVKWDFKQTHQPKEREWFNRYVCTDWVQCACALMENISYGKSPLSVIFSYKLQLLHQSRQIVCSVYVFVFFRKYFSSTAL